MRKLFVAGMLGLASSATWACPPGTIAQGVDSNGQAICVVANAGPGSGGNGNTTPPAGGGSVGGNYAGSGYNPQPESFFNDKCLTNLSMLATKKLQTQLLKDKAVTHQVQITAALGEKKLGDSCHKACNDYAAMSSMISKWSKMPVAYTSEPEHTMQKIYGSMQPLAMPDQAELDKCLPPLATANWCPQSGTGVGAGNTRHENALDNIAVCSSGGDALAHLNFSAADIARNCARTGIVDAAVRIEAEHKCITDAVKSEEKIKQAAADKAAADKYAAEHPTVQASTGTKLSVGAAPSTSGVRKMP